MKRDDPEAPEGNGSARGKEGERIERADRTKAAPAAAPGRAESRTIQDWRLEQASFDIRQVFVDGHARYEVSGDFSAPVPPLRESRYLSRAQSLELYRWMLLNRRMEQVLETLYKQSKVVGGVYFGLGQEACSCASAFALEEQDWFAPMIRNQGALLVRGFHPRDVMMQYMAKSGSPTKGKDGTSHYGDIGRRNMVSPISMLGDLIPILAGVALGARLQGKEIACLTWIGDGGQSTGVTHEGVNFAAVHKLGLVLIIENNLWAYSTPTEMQFAVRDLAERARGYGIPGLIIDGTDACQVFDATREAVERAHAGEGPTLIEAKMMRMKGHAIHDAASYVPRPLFEFFQRRDPIARLEHHLRTKGWLSDEERQEIASDVDRQLEEDRLVAEASPMPDPQDASIGVFCDDSHPITLKYGGVRKKPLGRPDPVKSETEIHLR